MHLFSLQLTRWIIRRPIRAFCFKQCLWNRGNVEVFFIVKLFGSNTGDLMNTWPTLLQKWQGSVSRGTEWGWLTGRAKSLRYIFSHILDHQTTLRCSFNIAVKCLKLKRQQKRVKRNQQVHKGKKKSKQEIKTNFVFGFQMFMVTSNFLCVHLYGCILTHIKSS